MDRARNVHRLDARPHRALDVGLDAIADGEACGAGHGPARDLGKACKDPLIDGRKRLAGPLHPAAHGFIGPGQRAAAIDEPLATLHLHVRIGADHRQAAGEQALEQGTIILRRFLIVVPEAGANDDLGRLRLGEGDIEALENRHVALGAQMIEGAPGERAHHGPGHIARGDHAVIGLARHAEAFELGDDGRLGARRVGDEQHDPAFAPEARTGRAGLLQGVHAIVHHAPDVHQPGALACGERRDGGEKRNGCGSRRRVHDAAA